MWRCSGATPALEITLGDLARSHDIRSRVDTDIYHNFFRVIVELTSFPQFSQLCNNMRVYELKRCSFDTDI